jgi:hypothetical protein
MTLYDTGVSADNVMPACENTSAALPDSGPFGNTRESNSSSRENAAISSAGQIAQGSKRSMEPRPDALWHTPNREAWATVGGRHFPVQSSEFRHWLAGRFFECNGEPASGYKLDELVSAFSAGALFKRPEHRVHLRIAKQGNAVWLDLADAEGRAIRIDNGGWRVVPAAEVEPKFFRPPNMRPLPEPMRGGEGAGAAHLRKLLNLSDEDTFRLLLTWLSFAIVPDKPYPIIAVSGPAGAARTKTSVLRRGTESLQTRRWRRQSLSELVSERTLCWRRESRANPSLIAPNSLVTGKLAGNFIRIGHCRVRMSRK